MTSTEIVEPLTIDDSYWFSFSQSYDFSKVSLGTVAATVPAGVVPGSIATLSMTPQTVPPNCVTTGPATEPNSCGALESDVAEHFGDAIGGVQPQSPLDQDPNAPIPWSQEVENLLPILPMAPSDGADPVLDIPPPNAIPTAYRLGQIAVTVKPGYSIYQVVSDHGGGGVQSPFTLPLDDIDRQEGLDRLFYVNVQSGTELAKIAEYAADTQLRVERAHAIPTTAEARLHDGDPYARSGAQWNLTGPTGIYAHGGWSRLNWAWPGNTSWKPILGFFGSRETKLAIIDSGINGQHVDLAGKVRDGWDFANFGTIFGSQDSDPSCDPPRVQQGHGTIVAGINAQTNNNTLLAGTNYRAPILPIRIRYECGEAPDNWLAGNPPDWFHRAGRLADAINISIAVDDANVCPAVRDQYKRGKLVISSSDQANSSHSEYPDRCSLTLAVTSSDRQGKLAAHVIPHEWQKVAAPGDDVYTTIDSSYSYEVAEADGSTVAAPAVAGVAQQLLSLGVGSRIAYDTLWRSGTPIPGCNGTAPAVNCRGRLHMDRALQAALRNGVAEFWDSNDRPWPWGPFSNDAGCGLPVTRSPDGVNYSYGGRFSIGLKCTDATRKAELYQWQRVVPGWNYRFFTGVIKEYGGPAAFLMQVVYYNAQGNPIGGRHQRSETINSTTVWKPVGAWSTSPAGAVQARVSISVAGNSPGSAYFDDLGFYVCGTPCSG